MSKRYLSWDPPKEEEIKEATVSAENTKPEPETEYGVVANAPFVNLRSEPSSRSDVIRLVPNWEKLEIRGSRKGFYKVKTNSGEIGWIDIKFVEKEAIK